MHNFKSLLNESDNISEFIQHLFTLKKEIDSDLTVRKFSKSLGFENPSLISDVLNDKKKVSTKLLSEILKSEKMHYSEQRFLSNLFNIENNINVELASEENLVIQKYWSLDYKDTQPISSLAILIRTAVRYYSGGLTIDELANKLGFFLTKEEILDSISELSKAGGILLNSGRYTIPDDEKLFFNSKGVDLIKIQKIISRVASFPDKLKQIACLSFYANKSEYYKVRETIYNTIEQFAIMAEKSSKETDLNDEKKLCVLYTSFFSLDFDDDWKA